LWGGPYTFLRSLRALTVDRFRYSFNLLLDRDLVLIDPKP
jgi:hypothetical protein